MWICPNCSTPNGDDEPICRRCRTGRPPAARQAGISGSTATGRTFRNQASPDDSSRAGAVRPGLGAVRPAALGAHAG